MAKNINNSEKIQNTVEDNGLSFTELIDQILNPSHDQNSEPQVKNEAIAVENTVLNLSQCDFCGISFSSSESSESMLNCPMLALLSFVFLMM